MVLCFDFLIFTAAKRPHCITLHCGANCYQSMYSLAQVTYHRLLRRSTRFFSRSVNMGKTLNELNFVNGVLKNLPVDEDHSEHPHSVHNACFSLVKPTPLPNPRLVCHSLSALKLIDLDELSIDEQFVRFFTGNEIIPGSETFSHCYCGHQFGTFAGQLGDGAAIYLGEIVNSKNEHWELQLKGAGLTPYSRDADGRKVLRSSLREFLCSEAMHSLGIPTTRAATCIVSDKKIARDQFYDGNPKMENCAVVSRLAQSFIRFGSFEIFKPRNVDSGSWAVGPSVGRHDILAQLADYVIKSLFPAIDSMEITQLEKYKLFYKEVVISTAKLTAKWQAVGFVHGVLNTDNMSILGLTLDYGPFGFMDRFDPDHIPNTSDTNGRYRFREQPVVCAWNLRKLAEALRPLVSLDETTDILSEHYFPAHQSDFMAIMMRKLGLLKSLESDQENLLSDQEVLSEFLQTLLKVGGDYTNSFRALSKLSLPGMETFDEDFEKTRDELIKQSSTHDEMNDYFLNYRISSMVQMKLMQLKFSGQAEAEMDDKTKQIVSRLQYHQYISELTTEEYTKEVHESWDSWLKKYIDRLNHEVVGHEEEKELKLLDEKRKKLMNANNPCYVLRNYLAEEAIKKAESGDFSEAKKLLSALEDPFTERAEFAHYTQKPTKSACKLRVSCSS